MLPKIIEPSKMSSNDQFTIAKELCSAIDQRDRWYHAMKYKHCFVGGEAVSWLVKSEYADTREEAVRMAEKMRQMHIFQHVANKQQFEDKPYFYRFNPQLLSLLEEEEIFCRNQKCIALIAHNNMKELLIRWVDYNKAKLGNHTLVATGTTGALLEKKTGLRIQCVKSGPLGGDQQIGAMIAEERVQVLIFFWDPMTTQPHDADVKALLRLAVMSNISIAMNVASADLLVYSLTKHPATLP